MQPRISVIEIAKKVGTRIFNRFYRHYRCEEKPNARYQTERHGFLCYYLSCHLRADAPQLIAKPYEERNAKEDFERAIAVFNEEIRMPSDFNESYDDIERKSVLQLFPIDEEYFDVITRFRDTLDSNLKVLGHATALLSIAVSFVNLTVPHAFDFYYFLPVVILSDLALEPRYIGLFNYTAYDALTCFTAFLILWAFYKLKYSRAQKKNAEEIRKFVEGHLRGLKDRLDLLARFEKDTKEGSLGAEKLRMHHVRIVMIEVWNRLRNIFGRFFLRGALYRVGRNTLYSIFIIPAMLILVEHAFDGIALRQFHVVSPSAYEVIGFSATYACLYLAKKKLLLEKSLDFIPQYLKGTAKDEALTFSEDSHDEPDPLLDPKMASIDPAKESNELARAKSAEKLIVMPSTRALLPENQFFAYGVQPPASSARARVRR
jgi:hypothetical protein